MGFKSFNEDGQFTKPIKIKSIEITGESALLAPVLCINLTAFTKHVLIYVCVCLYAGIAFTQECTVCMAGTFSGEGASSCTPCPANKHSAKNSVSCSDCDAKTEYSGEHWVER